MTVERTKARVLLIDYEETHRKYVRKFFKI